MALKAIQPKQAAPSKPKILIYGKPGVGKTWVSMEFPRVYYIDTEGGANLPHYTDKLAKSGGAYMGIKEGSLDFATVINELQQLSTLKHDYKTVVIDSISKLFNEEVLQEAKRITDKGSKNEFGADRKKAIQYMRSLVSWIQRLDMNVILISHEKIEWGTAGGQRAEVGNTFDAWDKLEYELHLALRIAKITDKHVATVRKSRLTGFRMDDAFSWSYEEFAKRYGKDIIESPAVPIALATEAQVKEINNLVKSINLPDGWIQKCLATANVSSFDDMESGKLETMINHIKTVFLPKQLSGE
jgi:hypothetical protein